jgi:hypothetical protein
MVEEPETFQIGQIVLYVYDYYGRGVPSQAVVGEVVKVGPKRVRLRLRHAEDRRRTAYRWVRKENVFDGSFL